MRAKLAGLLITACGAAIVVACAAHDSGAPDAALVDAAATIPPGPNGALIRYGRDIIERTPATAGRYIGARMSCAACHPGAGTIAHQGSLLGTYAKFPQWNRRAGRFIALQDRLAECFLYSMNGHPPAYESREMIALTAYIAWLSRGAKVGVGFPDQGPPNVKPLTAPSPDRGANVYASKCERCHAADGNGAGAGIPPLWGPQSFNDKAGMAHMDRMAPFVKSAMPKDAPGTLSDQEAFDVAAYVLTHPRPKFNPSRMIKFPAEKAGYF